MHNHELHATFKVRGQVGISRGLDASHHMPNDDELGMWTKVTVTLNMQIMYAMDTVRFERNRDLNLADATHSSGS